LSTLAGIGRVHCHNGRPLFTLSATTAAGPEVTYITPLATIGVPSSGPVPGGWYIHTGRSDATFAGEISVKGEYRWDEKVPE
jgi:hypothetical protein